jgi:hypothetical protein
MKVSTLLRRRRLFSILCLQAVRFKFLYLANSCLTFDADVNDPLNWTPRRKLLAATCALRYCNVSDSVLNGCSGVFVYTAGYGFSSTTIYSLLVGISTDTGISVATLVQGTGYLFGLLGWMGPFMLPMAFRYGARPMYCFSMVSQVAISVWTP